MAKSPADKSLYDILYDYQTRLQGVSNDLALKLSAVLMNSDAKVLALLREELPNYKRSSASESARIEKLLSKVEVLRSDSYSAAEELIFKTSQQITQSATTQTAKEFNKAIAAAQKKASAQIKELTKQQQETVIEGRGIDGASIGDWFKKWKRDDLERFASLAKRASVEQMSVADITKAVKGTVENKYADGILTQTKSSAAKIARTIVNGVSNNARLETIAENSESISGVKFIGTLDGKTCPYCASYDGYIWRGEEIIEARRPPIHPNCRCCLVPYVEKDEEGTSVDDGERSAAEADFDQLAKDAYNQQAQEKGWNRRWDDLSPSTRLKYFYKAQKDYEEQTGRPAFRKVSGATTFQEYFQRQPDSFKRAWLGEKRYELYKSGKLTEKSIFKPDLTYQVSGESFRSDTLKPEQQEKETKPEKEQPPKDEKQKKETKTWNYEKIQPQFRASQKSWEEELKEIKRSDVFAQKIKELEEAAKKDLNLLLEKEPKNDEV